MVRVLFFPRLSSWVALGYLLLGCRFGLFWCISLQLRVSALVGVCLHLEPLRLAVAFAPFCPLYFSSCLSRALPRLSRVARCVLPACFRSRALVLLMAFFCYLSLCFASVCSCSFVGSFVCRQTFAPHCCRSRSFVFHSPLVFWAVFPCLFASSLFFAVPFGCTSWRGLCSRSSVAFSPVLLPPTGGAKRMWLCFAALSVLPSDSRVPRRPLPSLRLSFHPLSGPAPSSYLFILESSALLLPLLACFLLLAFPFRRLFSVSVALPLFRRFSLTSLAPFCTCASFAPSP